MNIISEYIVRFFNLISPKQCVVCGCRLSVTEDVICSVCNCHLPRTHFSKQPYDNIMAKSFWGRIRIERATAFFFYEHHSEVSHIIHSMKYFDHPETGELMGRMLAEEAGHDGFFESVDIIVPIPLAKSRQRTRGFNQSEEIARGISEITHIPVCKNAVKRKTFRKSQTEMNRWQRLKNTEDAFKLINGNAVKGKHVLLVDDVVTSGATVISCAQELAKCGDVRFSVISLGYSKS